VRRPQITAKTSIGSYTSYWRGLVTLMTKPSLGAAHMRSTARWLETKRHRKRDYAPHLRSIQEAISITTDVGPESLSSVWASSPLQQIREKISARRSASRKSAIPQASDGSWTLGEIMYLVCRILSPSIVIETGVGFGITSAYILQAMEDNGTGVLHSIEFADLWFGYRESVGSAVDPSDRSHWRLHFGPSEAILPALLGSIGGVDIFLHDSSHTYRDMLIEYSTIWPRLRPGGLLISDDVDGCDAFIEFAEGRGSFAVVPQDTKRHLIGMLHKGWTKGHAMKREDMPFQAAVKTAIL